MPLKQVVEQKGSREVHFFSKKLFFLSKTKKTFMKHLLILIICGSFLYGYALTKPINPPILITQTTPLPIEGNWILKTINGNTTYNNITVGGYLSLKENLTFDAFVLGTATTGTYQVHEDTQQEIQLTTLTIDKTETAPITHHLAVQSITTQKMILTFPDGITLVFKKQY
jgi:hypothetical protein